MKAPHPKDGNTHPATTPQGRDASYRHTGLEYLAWTDDPNDFSRGGQLKVALAKADRRAEARA